MTLDTKALGLDRRMFLRGAAGAGTAIALQALMARSATAQPGPGFDLLGPKPKPAPNNGGYGPLERAPGGELWLPTRTGQRLEIPLPVEWVDIDDPDPDTGGELAVFNQGRAKGGAVFSRLEGAWWGDGAAYIVSTDGGNAQLGQVWEYRPLAGRFGLLRLIYESVDATLLESPDNITVSPRTNGMVLCEDGDGIDRCEA